MTWNHGYFLKVDYLLTTAFFFLYIYKRNVPTLTIYFNLMLSKKQLNPFIVTVYAVKIL